MNLQGQGNPPPPQTLPNYKTSKEECRMKTLQKQAIILSGDKINFSALATRYPITVVKSGKKASNAGQIVKQYLIENGINVDAFKNRYSLPRVKRNRLR